MLKWLKPTSDIDYVLAIQENQHSIYASKLFEYCYDYFIKTMIKKHKINNDDAQDLFQKSFITLWYQIENKNIIVKDNKLYRWKIEKSNNELFLASLDCSLRSYLVLIGDNNYKNFKRLSGITISLEESKEVILAHDYLEFATEHDFKMLVIQECIEMLPEGCRTLLKMFFFEHLTNKEVLARTAPRYSNDASLKVGKNKCMDKLKSHVQTNLKKVRF